MQIFLKSFSSQSINISDIIIVKIAMNQIQFISNIHSTKSDNWINPYCYYKLKNEITINKVGVAEVSN